MASFIGEIINNRYKIDSELGKGGMGTVYRAHDATLKRDVAVKVLSNFKLGTEGRARLLHEAQSVAKLNHSNIVTVHDAGEIEKTPYIVMELVEGGSLHEHPPKDFEQTVVIARQLCAALEHAHKQGIIHRDLKPENVVLDGNGQAKLMDFGLARSVSSRLTSEGTIVGTVFYMAPEQSMGKELDERADLYALGVMLYEFTTGMLPYEDSDPIAIISQHIHAPLVPPRAKNEDIPPLLNDLIVNLLSKDREDRPASAAEVQIALENPDLLDARAVAVEELSALERIVRGRMVGRKAEFNQAKEIWGQASKGKGKLLLVSGEPGVGKTRMTREIITHAEVSGGKSFVGASFAEGDTPYAPIRQILRHALQMDAMAEINLPDAVLADLLALVPDARPHFPQAKDLPADIQSNQDTLFEHLTVFFNLLAAQAPLLLVLEDVHWADSGSLYLLRHLARNITAQPILLLGTYREVELDEALPFNETLLGLEREGLPTRIKLSRLTRDQTRDLLAAMLEEEITDEFLDGIYRETDGNPFFISEVCKALIESGKLFFHDGKWDRPSIEEMGIPQSVRVAIQSRVGKLSEGSQAVLTQAAVLGREFDFPTLKLALDKDEDTLIDALEDALDAQLIEELNGSGEEFVFAHALIPTSIVEGLRTLKRRSLHRRAAKALLERHPDDIAALAHHYLEAGDTEEAVDYLLQLGDQARILYAHQEAYDSYLQALDFLVETEDYLRASQTQMKLALAYESNFDFAAAQQAYERAFQYHSLADTSMETKDLPPAPHAFRTHQETTPPTLDISVSYDVTSYFFIENLFSGLVGLTADLNIVPDVAERWEIKDQGTRYVFHLRMDVEWSDGQPVTARDFQTMLLRALDPEDGNTIPTRFFEIKNAEKYMQREIKDFNQVGIKAMDDHTLEFTLEGPCAFFLPLVAGFGYPVPTHVIEKHGASWTDIDKIVTNGPFRLEKFESGVEYRFRKNPKYHRAFPGNLEEVVLIAATPEKMMQLYDEGQFDILGPGSLPIEMAARVKKKHRNDLLTAPAAGTGYFVFDHRQPPFDDVRVRRAFALAIDRTALAKELAAFDFIPATGGLIPPGIPGHTPNAAIPFDPLAARELFAAAGFPGGKGFPELVGLGNDQPFNRQATAVIRDQWTEVLGVNIGFEYREDYGVFLEEVVTSPPPLYLGGWAADFPDPDSFLRATLWEGSIGWKSQDFEDLVEAAHRSLVQTERINLYQQAEEILKKDVPLIPIAYGRFALLKKPWVAKLPLSIMNTVALEDIIINPH